MPSTCIQNGQFLGANCTTGTGYLVLLTQRHQGCTGPSGRARRPTTRTILTALGAGDPTCPSITNPTLNAICQLTGAHLQIAPHVGVNPANVVLSFSFTTQSTLDTLELHLRHDHRRADAHVHPIGITTADIPGLGLPGHADIYVGTLTIPYYSSKSAPLTDFWHAPPFPLDPTSTFVTRYNPLPVPTADPADPGAGHRAECRLGARRRAARRRLAGADLPARHHAQPRGRLRGG